MKLTPELKEIALRVAQDFISNRGTDKAFIAVGWLPTLLEETFAALPNSEPMAYHENGRWSFNSDGGPDKWRERKKYNGPLYAAPPIPQDYKAQLAESQAREVKMQASMKWVRLIFTDATLAQERDQELWLPSFEEAIAAPSDATALNELIAKAGEVMRERIVSNILRCGALGDGEYMNAIRAIPGATLEDLKLMDMAGKCYCPAYDERCNGCLNEARWIALLDLPIDERISMKRKMHLIDEGCCQDNGMSEKELKS